MRRLTPSGSRLTSTPPTRAVPAVGLSRPHSMRIVVDLPAPLLPRKPKISPWRTSNVRSFTATNSPKRRVRCCTRWQEHVSGRPPYRRRSPSNRPRETRLRQPDVRECPGTIELRLQLRELGVEHLGVRDDAGLIPRGDDALSLG